MECRYRDCQRPARPRWTMCARHGSASGLTRAMWRQLQAQKAKRRERLEAQAAERREHPKGEEDR